MTTNCNISVIPFYTSKSLRHREQWYAFGQRFKLCVPANRILPFQFVIPSGTSPVSVTDAKLYDADTDTEKTLQSDLLDTLNLLGLTLSEYSDNYGESVSVIYPANGTHSALPTGYHYITLTIGGVVYYSEEFCVVPSSYMETMTRIEWGNADDIRMTGSAIRASAGDTPFVNTLYLEGCDISRPNYLFEEEVKVRNGFDFPERQLSEKQYSFDTVLPEYLLDAIRIAPMSDMLRVTDKFGREYQCDHMTIDSTWSDGGDLAIASFTFETNTAVVKIGRGQFADYNDDYLNDYFNGIDNE